MASDTEPPEPPGPSPDSASLVKRLAGPSTNKAGLAKDQTEINRIIADASKGSKFYENEKKKDKDLTERIARILHHRDDVQRGVDLEKVKSSVDQLLVEMESRRDLSQTIVHVDMDAFYANVEVLDNPDLAGKPFGVGHGVLTTASYEARKFGVRSGMPGFIAKKLCPDIILVDMHFPRYSEMSKKVMDIFRRYDSNMCPAGSDEGYLNITSYCEEHGMAVDECVQEMRRTVHDETKLTVSAGIAPNKMLAKICSDKNKPNGQYHLPFERQTIMSFMHDLSIRKVPGVGRVNERLLESIGVKTCGDIYAHRATISLLDKQFGLRFLLNAYLGISSNVVRPSQREERKSIGAERTFNTLSTKERILKKLDEVSEELESDMEKTGWAGRTITLKYKLDTYQVFTRAKSCNRWVTKKDDLYSIGKDLLLKELPLKLRLIGLRVTKLKDLRATESEGSIKRFLDSAQASPNKKQKLLPDVDPDDDDEAMPGFHEHEEDDILLDDGLADDESDMQPELRTGYISSRRPLSTSSAPQSASSSSKGSTQIKPLSTGYHRTQAKKRGLDHRESQTCPICFKVLETDNNGLNEHIDFCLSKAAIKEATVHVHPPSDVKYKQGSLSKGKGRGAG